MKYFLLVLCALGTLLGLFVGGCSIVLAGFGITGSLTEPITTALAVGTPAVSVMLVNIAIIDAIRRGKTERRGSFVVLAGVDFLVAAVLAVIALTAGGGLWLTAALAGPFALKGALTLLLFRPATPAWDTVAEQEPDREHAPEQHPGS